MVFICGLLGFPGNYNASFNKQPWYRIKDKNKVKKNAIVHYNRRTQSQHCVQLTL